MRQIARFLFAGAALALSACTDSAPGTGTLTVQMTDAPFPFAEVQSVDVFVVRIDGKTEEASDAEAEDSDDMSEWTTIATPNRSVDLLSLRNGVTTNLGSTTLTTGTYRGFRLVIDPEQSSITLSDGSHPSITFPSAAHSGIKIKLDEPIEVVEGGTVMVLDFDVGRSFVMKGNSIKNNGLNFKPVIRAVASELTGSASGTVRLDSPTGALVAGATVEILKAGTALNDATPENVVATTVTDAEGAWTVNFLLPGTYVVRATPPTTATGYLPALLSGGLTMTSDATVTNQLIVVTK